MTSIIDEAWAFAITAPKPPTALSRAGFKGTAPRFRTPTERQFSANLAQALRRIPASRGRGFIIASHLYDFSDPKVVERAIKVLVDGALQAIRWEAYIRKTEVRIAGIMDTHKNWHPTWEQAIEMGLFLPINTKEK